MSYLVGHEPRIMIEEILQELERARCKFPTQSRATTILALVEETGEVAQAHLQGQPEDAYRKECVQAAVMAIRCALDTKD